MMVKNRTNRDVEFTFDGQVHVIKAKEVVPMVHEAAVHGIRKSVISFNPITMQAVRALCNNESADADIDIEPRVPGSEIIDRSDMGPDDKKVEIKKFVAPNPKAASITSPLAGLGDDEE